MKRSSVPRSRPGPGRRPSLSMVEPVVDPAGGDQAATERRQRLGLAEAVADGLEHGVAPRGPTTPPRWRDPTTGATPASSSSIMPSPQRSPRSRASTSTCAPSARASSRLPWLKRTNASRPVAQPSPPRSPSSANVCGRAVDAALGLVDPALDEGDPGQVLQRPGLAPPVAGLAGRRPARRGSSASASSLSPRKIWVMPISRMASAAPWSSPRARKWSTASARVRDGQARSPLSRSTSPRTSSERAIAGLVAQLERQRVGLVDVGAGRVDVADVGQHAGPTEQQLHPAARCARVRAGAAPGCSRRSATGQGLGHLGPAGGLLAASRGRARAPRPGTPSTGPSSAASSAAAP